MNEADLKILFVCMGNICRSPTAEAVFSKKLNDQDLFHKIKIDSAGTHNFHPDAPPDARSQKHALKRGYDMSHLRARPVVESDFEYFDLLLTMDWDNRALLEERCPALHLHKIRGFAEFLQTTQASVIPDPYYGGEQGFEHVLDLIEEASEGLMKFVHQKVQDDATLVARRLATLTSGLYASPSYLVEHGEPKLPDDFVNHKGVLILRRNNEHQGWSLSKGEQRWDGTPPNSFAANSPGLLVRMASAGCGIIAVNDCFALPRVKSGELRRVMPDWQLPSDDAWAVFVGRKLMPAKTREFIRMMQIALDPTSMSV
jgi:protein-tyrosine phosphatase